MWESHQLSSVSAIANPWSTLLPGLDFLFRFLLCEGQLAAYCGFQARPLQYFRNSTCKIPFGFQPHRTTCHSEQESLPKLGLRCPFCLQCHLALLGLSKSSQPLKLTLSAKYRFNTWLHHLLCTRKALGSSSKGGFRGSL